MCLGKLPGVARYEHDPPDIVLHPLVVVHREPRSLLAEPFQREEVEKGFECFKGMGLGPIPSKVVHLIAVGLFGIPQDLEGACWLALLFL